MSKDIADTAENATLCVRKWDVWQHYRKDRGSPSWIKLHRCVMRDWDWIDLTDAQRGQLVSIWLLAADHGSVIPASSRRIRILCHMETEPDLQLFISKGFLEVPSDGCQVVTTWLPDDAKVTHQRREEESREEEIRGEERRGKAEGAMRPNGLDEDYAEEIDL